MNLRHRWWMAGALLCLSVASMQRARGEELPALSPGGAEHPVAMGDATVHEAGAADPGLTPFGSDTRLWRLRREAEASYQARNFGDALIAFEQLVVLQPDDTQAWFRLGNLHQQAGRDAQAMDAYRSASRIAADDEPATHARAKALLNLALLGVQAASRAIDEFDAMRPTATLAPARDAAARQVGAARRRAGRASARLEASTRPAAAADAIRKESAGSGSSHSVSSAPESDAVRLLPAPADFHPYTVDRWIATPRRSAEGRSRARASVQEPLTGTPLPPPPVVDVIRAVPDTPSTPDRAGKR